VESSRYCES